MLLKKKIININNSDVNNIDGLRFAINNADAVVIGAGAGLSASAGFTYSGERFDKYFSDFAVKYGIKDMYSGGFYPFESINEYWAYWSRYIYINRYMNTPKPLYEQLLEVVKDKDYFVIITNVDHCFQKAGFDKSRLYYTQGDYGLFQCSESCHNKTYDNEEAVNRMVESQGFRKNEEGGIYLPEGVDAKMFVPDELIPRCAECGKPMSMNLRADDTFVQDDGWYKAAERYELFLNRYKNAKVLFWELGVGFNTPGIIKYPFWQMTAKNMNSVYSCVNKGETYVSGKIMERSICVNADIEEVLKQL
ncbi:MAG: Sir2 silent information regulator family NAD-dependent deacetylase [Firmicutes bacterium]|nr:Sir2 silent information regulator family NAD-dependent deacetylase [Bacillota bacterium]